MLATFSMRGKGAEIERFSRDSANRIGFVYAFPSLSDRPMSRFPCAKRG